MSSLNGNLIINGTIKYNVGTNLTAAVQSRLLYSGTITGTTGTSPTLTNTAGSAYRRDIIANITIPSGYSRIRCTVCNANGTSSGLTLCTTPYIYNQGGGLYLAGVVIFNIANAVAYRINYLVYATLDQA